MFAFNMHRLCEQPQYPVYITIKYVTSVGEHSIPFHSIPSLLYFLLIADIGLIISCKYGKTATLYTNRAGSVLTQG